MYQCISNTFYFQFLCRPYIFVDIIWGCGWVRVGCEWNIYNISQFNLPNINIGKRSLSPTQLKQIFRRGVIYSPTLVKKSKNFWLPSKITYCCPALDNNVLFSTVSKEWFRCVNYLEPGIMAERCFYITRYQEWKWCLLL